MRSLGIVIIGCILVFKSTAQMPVNIGVMASKRPPLSTDINLIRAGGTFGADNWELLNSLINNNPNKNIVIPPGGTIYMSRPLFIPSNTTLTINGTLKLTDGVVRPLAQDAAIGQNRVYVDNADGSFQAGQYASVGADNYPLGGGGATPRKMGQFGKIVTATSTYVEFEYNLRSTISGVAVGDLLVANNATIGHTQTMFYCRDAENIVIQGTGMIDGNLPTMHSEYHPCAMGGNTAAVPGYEDAMGGNGIVFWNCTNVSVGGSSATSKLSMQEFNIGSILAVLVNGYNFSNIHSYHPYMKHLAFSLGADNGLCENLVFNTSYNEDGLSLHDEGHYSTFRNIQISNCPRIGLGVGSGSHHNTFEDITVQTSGFGLYSIPSNGSPDVHDNTFTNLIISNCAAGVLMTMVQNTVFNNLNVSFNGNGNHCITIGGQCHDIIFNGGGSYDTQQLNRNGYGFRTVAAESFHDYESYNITFNNFDFVRLEKGIHDAGSFPVTFDNCTFDDNQANGDLTSADFILIQCTVDGLPYP